MNRFPAGGSACGGKDTLVTRSFRLILPLCLLAGAAMLATAAPVRAEPPKTFRQAVPSDEDIGDEYGKPTADNPEPRAQAMHWVDLALFVGALVAAAWLIHRKRSRAWLIALVTASVLYFGFYRSGCVCPIGATQNVLLSLIDRGYTISIVITLIFLLPLAAALFMGRVFCGGVCWLGGVQDLIHRRTVRVPRWMDKTLRWGRWVYLGLAAYWVVGGVNLLFFDGRVKREFVICKFDPFVNLFRSVNVQAALNGTWNRVFDLAGPWWMWIVTGVVLGSGIFIGRPYCRWLCPYGALLGVCSRAARRGVTVMPDACCDCKLCDDACPYGAIEEHAAVKSTCLACNRCYQSCPLERQRLGVPVAMPALVQLGTGTEETRSLTIASPRSGASVSDRAEREETPVPAVADRSPVRYRRLAPSADPEDIAYVDAMVALHGRSADAGLPILQAIQARHGYLPHAAIARVVELTDATMAQVISLATFYNRFRTDPVGKHLVRVCVGTACHVAGARLVGDALRRHLGIMGEADTDALRRFTVQEVACVGCCSLAPVVQVDEHTFGHRTPDSVVKAIDAYEQAEREPRMNATGHESE
ncbi:MAG: hypothetical protein BIFFINMI_00084 [Phycisphaerae bacterium]|nr:hypothetical protein [Phycisphaerae bacterium]